MPEYKPPQPRNALEAGLGFRIEIMPNGKDGHVVWFDRVAGVRPATPVEIQLWRTLVIATAGPPGAVHAHTVVDPFGTPKERGSGA